MPDSFVIVADAASGKQLSGWERTKNNETVLDQEVLLSEAFLPAYSVSTTTAVSTATDGTHLLQIMAGSANRVAMRRLKAYQVAAAGASAIVAFELVLLTTAGIGGTPYTPRALDPVDVAAGATAMARPTTPGTESNVLWNGSGVLLQSPAVAGRGLVLDEAWTDPRTKPPTIAAGTSNGLALKIVTGVASATVRLYVEFVEVAWS